MKVDNLNIRWHYPKTKHMVKDIIKYSIVDNKTVCTIEHPEIPGTLGYGECWCSKKDQFSRDKGRKLSLLRALINAGIPKEERTKVWESYRNMKPSKRW